MAVVVATRWWCTVAVLGAVLWERVAVLAVWLRCLLRRVAASRCRDLVRSAEWSLVEVLQALVVVMVLRAVAVVMVLLQSVELVRQLLQLVLVNLVLVKSQRSWR